MKHLLLTLMVLVLSMASAQTIPEIIGGAIADIIGSDAVPSTPNAQAIAESISGEMAEKCGEIYPTLRDYRRANLGREIQPFDVFLSPRDGEACEVTRRDMSVYRCRYNVAWGARPREILLRTDASGTPLSVRRIQDTPASAWQVADFDARPRPGVLEELQRLREAEKQRAIAEARQDYQRDLERENVALSMVANVESDYRQAFSMYTENKCDAGFLPEIDRIINPRPLTHGRPDF